MSVSTLESSVPASSTFDTPSPAPQAKASRPAPSVDGQNATNVSFRSQENQTGPVFGDHQPPTDRAGQRHDPLATTQAMRHPGFMERFKDWMSHWFGGHCPPMHRPCNGAPPRPHPGSGAPSRPHPKPDYSMQNHEQLTQALLDNFKAFTGSHHARFMTTRDIREMASRPLGNDPVMNNNIRLAREILNRPDLMQALDRNNGTGATDNRFSKQDLRNALNDTNFFRYKDDKEIAREMLSHFDELARRWGGKISIRDLHRLAAQPLTGDSPRDHLIQLAQVLLRRGNLLMAMDRNGDGYLSRRELQRLSS